MQCDYQTLESTKKLTNRSKILDMTSFFDDEGMTNPVGEQLSQGVNANVLVKKVITNCIKCSRFADNKPHQLMVD